MKNVLLVKIVDIFPFSVGFLYLTNCFSLSVYLAYSSMRNDETENKSYPMKTYISDSWYIHLDNYLEIALNK